MRSSLARSSSSVSFALGVKAHIQLTVISLLGFFVGGCASPAKSPPSAQVTGFDCRKPRYLLEVTFVWGAGTNPYRTIQTEIEVGRAFYVKVLDEAGNYHAIQGTLQEGKDGVFHLRPLHYANWSVMGSTYGTAPLDLRVGKPTGGGTNAGMWSVRLLPLPERLSVEPDGPADRSQPIRSETNRTSSAAGSRR